jgi:hypothetical protein
MTDQPKQPRCKYSFVDEDGKEHRCNSGCERFVYCEGLPPDYGDYCPAHAWWMQKKIAAQRLLELSEREAIRLYWRTKNPDWDDRWDWYD